MIDKNKSNKQSKHCWITNLSVVILICTFTVCQNLLSKVPTDPTALEKLPIVAIDLSEMEKIDENRIEEFYAAWNSGNTLLHKKAKIEIEDILLPNQRYYRIKNDNEYKIIDRCKLLEETTIILPLPKGIHIPEQIKRAAAWEYRLAPDRDIFKEEYLALVRDPVKWVRFISKNTNILLIGAERMIDSAVKSGNVKMLEDGFKTMEIVLSYHVTSVFWNLGVEDCFRSKNANKTKNAKKLLQN